MKTFLYGSALIALPVLPLVPAFAAYDPAIIAADARWVVYADFNALRASTLGKELVVGIEKAQSMATGGVIGLDVSKVLATVGSLTAYGTNLSTNPAAIDGALIVQGTPELRKIAESLLLQGTLSQPSIFSDVSDLPFPAYAVSDPHASEGARTQVVIAFPTEPIVIVSKSKSQVQKARDVFRGSAPSLAKGGSPLHKLAANAEGAFLFGASVVPTESLFPQNAPQARILQLASSGAIAFGERGPNTFAHAELLASSEQGAEKLMKILQGMTAMLSLAETNDRQLADFISSTGVTRNKDTVTLHLAYSSARLVQMTQALLAKEEARPAKNRPVPITMGRVLEEWGEDGVGTPEVASPGEPVLRTIENVKLVNGCTITVGRVLNGGKNARFTGVEILPADGVGAPLTFRSEYMRAVGGRGTMAQFVFPGADGTYKLRVTFLPDPDGKAKFAVSVGDPKAVAPAPAAPSRGPLIPQPKLPK